MTASTSAPLAIGDRVKVFGVAGVIEAIAQSKATGQRVFTVSYDGRIRLRVVDRDVERIEEKR